MEIIKLQAAVYAVLGHFTYNTPTPNTHISNGFSYIGCYTDNTTARTLTTQVQIQPVTIASCQQSCLHAGFRYAGLDYEQCFCGSSISNTGTPDVETMCDYPCLAETSETCGGSEHISVYQAGSLPTFEWESIGCVHDQGRSLSYHVYPAEAVTVKTCQDTCQAQGFSIAGTVFGDQCWCDNAWLAGEMEAASGCDVACAGDESKMCGGKNKLSASRLVEKNPQELKREVKRAVLDERAPWSCDRKRDIEGRNVTRPHVLDAC